MLYFQWSYFVFTTLLDLIFNNEDKLEIQLPCYPPFTLTSDLPPLTHRKPLSLVLLHAIQVFNSIYQSIKTLSFLIKLLINSEMTFLL